MPDIRVNGVRLHYVERGSGPEAIVFSDSYLVDWSDFKPQIDALSDRYRRIAFDHLGHGPSERPNDGYDKEKPLSGCGRVHRSHGSRPSTPLVFRREDSSVCDSDFADRSSLAP